MPDSAQGVIGPGSIYWTRFYSDCLGVFQGGGCRAVAFAGAHAAAHRLGVRFSEVAGTSAGSIVAALLAAGAEPDFLLEKLRALAFPILLKKVNRPSFPDQKRLGMFARFVPDSFRKAALCLDNGGIYSSEGVEEWVEQRLRELLPSSKSPVQFDQLIMPLYVVASDLSSMRPRVWSSHATPEASVAHAVRASCTIPLFFQSVEEGSMLLVDGGLVSNSPVFVFASKSELEPFLRRPTLLFALEADESSERPKNFLGYLQRLVSLCIDGGTDVQLRSQPSVARIAIPTAAVHATDFDKMDAETVETLIKKGGDAAESFIRRELLHARNDQANTRRMYDEHQAFLRLTEQLNAARHQVTISFPDTKWFWELFPTIFYWIRQGIRVSCFASPLNNSAADAPKERQRRSLIRGVGSELVETANLPFWGFFIDDGTDPTSFAVLFAMDRLEYEPIAEYYMGRSDRTVLAALYEKFKPQLIGERRSAPAVELEAASSDQLITLLKTNVWQYRNAATTIAVEDVDINKVLLISRYVRAFRYQQIEKLVEAFRQAKLDLFEPAIVRLQDGGSSIVTPPVFEATADSYVALEGNTRSLYCLNNGIAKIRAVVVRDADGALPGVPIPLKQVRITSSRHRPDERIAGFDRNLFRDIERAARPLDG